VRGSAVGTDSSLRLRRRKRAFRAKQPEGILHGEYVRHSRNVIISPKTIELWLECHNLATIGTCPVREDRESRDRRTQQCTAFWHSPGCW
jgi:hypothetical protein